MCVCSRQDLRQPHSLARASLHRHANLQQARAPGPASLCRAKTRSRKVISSLSRHRETDVFLLPFFPPLLPILLYFRITTRLPLATIFADIRIAVPAVSCSNPLHLQLHTHPFSQAHPASLATMTVLSRSRKLMIVIAISLAFFLAEISGKYCPLCSPIVRANTSQSASTLARSLSWLMPSIT